MGPLITPQELNHHYIKTMTIQTPTGLGILVEADEECVSVQYPDGSIQFWLWQECDLLNHSGPSPQPLPL
ncbi:MAG: hypothetical protein F6K19_40575 [Cyanothece sp. SIO1E1]|nr:hypothetical protein [Cyanothece sp. SIO1E1]